ncbi:hypothetical protein ACH4CE_34990 [Streptomyces gelaticus]
MSILTRRAELVDREHLLSAGDVDALQTGLVGDQQMLSIGEKGVVTLVRC